jgi:dTMP kinase
MRGIFISFEGSEGSGKSTQARLLSDWLRTQGISTILTREPGGTPIGERIREVLLSPDHREMDPITELFLYLASRRQHIKELIEPSLKEGKIVITDRFSDSTMAYQGYGRGLDLSLIESLNRTATGGLSPDLTIVLDVDVREGLSRNLGIKSDRLEIEDIEFHEKVRRGFIEIAKKEPKRVFIVETKNGIEKTHDEILAIVREWIKR